MTISDVLIGCSLIFSLAANAVLVVKLRTDKAKPKPSYEASALLRDILGGQALVRIERIAPENVFLRSPRDVV
jgi:hypothetical protein